MTTKLDCLTEDEPIVNQNWVCISIVTPETLQNCDVRGVKVRGVYATEEQAKKRCEQLRAVDPYHNIYIAPVGKWLPWCDDPEKAEDFNYAETQLNDLMVNYRKNQMNAKVFHEQRKQEMIDKSLKEMEEQKGKNEEMDIIQTDDLQEELDEINAKMDELNNVDTNDEVKNVDTNDELENAQDVYEKMMNDEK